MTNNQINPQITNKQMENRQIDIHERVYQFVKRVLKLLHSLPPTVINKNIIDQCSRSATSVGANDQEADGCASKRDFLAKYAIAKKELKEANYWLRLIADTNPEFKGRMSNLIKEGREILLVISTIINNTRKGNKQINTNDK